MEAEGWRFVAFTRLVPLFPFNLLNYALGLTRIPLPDHALGTFVFMLPGALAYTYPGYAGREAVAGSDGLVRNGLIGLAVLAVAAFLPRLVLRLRERPMLNIGDLKRRVDDAVGLVLDVRSTADFVGEQGHIAWANSATTPSVRFRSSAVPTAVRQRPRRCSREAVSPTRAWCVAA